MMTGWCFRNPKIIGHIGHTRHSAFLGIFQLQKFYHVQVLVGWGPWVPGAG
jgi:hypothetical protein